LIVVTKALENRDEDSTIGPAANTSPDRGGSGRVWNCEGDDSITMERYIRAIAGTFIIGSLVLSRIHSPYWLSFTAFVGANLFQSAFTRWCLMEKILAKIGVGGSSG